jgi:hypothetical protein
MPGAARDAFAVRIRIGGAPRYIEPEDHGAENRVKWSDGGWREHAKLPLKIMGGK